MKDELEIIHKLIQVGQLLERGHLEYSGAQADAKHYAERYVALKSNHVEEPKTTPSFADHVRRFLGEEKATEEQPKEIEYLTIDLPKAIQSDSMKGLSEERETGFTNNELWVIETDVMHIMSHVSLSKEQHEVRMAIIEKTKELRLSPDKD